MFANFTNELIYVSQCDFVNVLSMHHVFDLNEVPIVSGLYL